MTDSIHGSSGRISEELLFQLARLLYRSEIAHNDQMKASLQDESAYASFRAGEVDRVIGEVMANGISLDGKLVVDFGCNDGALTSQYLQFGAARVIGLDIDPDAVARARALRDDARLTFATCSGDSLPLDAESCDVVISYDVFEHVAQPAVAAREIARILRPGGRALVGTQGWYHPFAPHLWSTMPVPWAHVAFSERTLLAACRRVYRSDWYVPNMHDFDTDGRRIAGKYQGHEISRDYLNHLLIKDYEAIFRQTGFVCRTRAIPFSSRFAAWTRLLLNTPLKEFFSAYAWFILEKRAP